MSGTSRMARCLGAIINKVILYFYFSFSMVKHNACVINGKSWLIRKQFMSRWLNEMSDTFDFLSPKAQSGYIYHSIYSRHFDSQNVWIRLICDNANRIKINLTFCVPVCTMEKKSFIRNKLMWCVMNRLQSVISMLPAITVWSPTPPIRAIIAQVVTL